MSTLKDFGFEDIKVIGRGQYGKAHLVRSEKEGGFYYIAKTIDLTCLSSKEKETALQEVALLRRLDHPNIVEYRDNFFMADTLVIIMQYCEGGDLQTFIKEKFKEKKRIQEAVVMHYFVQVLQALQYIHTERILHRDLKTSNLFLMKSKRVVKLGDFGISRVLEGSIEAAITVVGTPYYMSPEVCENKPYTFKSDVWSLGCVLYELCMLKHAFSADNLLGLVYKIVSDKYEPIPKMYSPKLNELIQRMLEKDADKRPSVRELLADPWVQSFMNEWVRTRGQCATPGAASSKPRVGTAGSGGGSIAPGASAAPGSTAVPAKASPSGSPNAAAAAAAAGPAPASRGSGTGAAAPSGGRSVGARPGSGDRPGEPRPPRVRATKREAGAGRVVGAAGAAAAAPRKVGETPKEAAARRKREAADRQAAELKVAARQAGHNKLVARQMKEVEFQSTRLAPGNIAGAAVAAGVAAAARGGFASPGGSTADPSQTGSGFHDEGSGSETAEDMEYMDSPIDEEISEDYSEDEDGTEYEDDFDSEGDSEEHEPRPPGASPCADYHGEAAGIREEQDFGRVMANYEHDISRTRSGHSPTRRSQATTTGHLNSSPVRSPSPFASPSASPAAAAATAPGGGGFGAGKDPGIMDMRSRATKLKEELTAKMGAETFQKAFDYLSQARSKGVDERTVRRELEALVGRETYKRFCFDVDQLVFQQIVYK